MHNTPTVLIRAQSLKKQRELNGIDKFYAKQLILYNTILQIITKFT